MLKGKKMPIVPDKSEWEGIVREQVDIPSTRSDQPQLSSTDLLSPH